MANNRMGLICSCGDWISIFKYYPAESWYVNIGSDTAIKKTDEWLEKHADCSPDTGSYLGPTHFKIFYESEQPEGKQTTVGGTNERKDSSS